MRAGRRGSTSHRGPVLGAAETAGSIRWAEQARRGRRRLYPVTVVYSLLTTVALGHALQASATATAASWLAGVAFWTWLEYMVHRYILHGVFPDGPGLRRLTHRLFDHLHVEHHKRPWDGNHINGTLKDTAPFLAPARGARAPAAAADAARLPRGPRAGLRRRGVGPPLRALLPLRQPVLPLHQAAPPLPPQPCRRLDRLRPDERSLGRRVRHADPRPVRAALYGPLFEGSAHGGPSTLHRPPSAQA